MKSFLLNLFIAVVFVLVGWFANTAFHLPAASKSPSAVKPTPLAKYTIENLSHTYVSPVNIEVGKELSKHTKFTSYEFSLTFDPTLTNAPLKKVSGLINIPKGKGPFPLIVMFRGYVDPSVYYTGQGSQHAGEFFADNGFVTIAPDFLGYGNSDKEASDVFESRFQTYTTAITLLKSVGALKGNPLKVGTDNISIDSDHIFIWGHSNGGQIALTALEITGLSYPTVLWAPVSKPFPYSILYYTDESTDGGKFLRKKTAEFEDTYNSGLYSLTNNLTLIKAPIQLSQGTADDAVPEAWSDLLSKNLENTGVDVEYIKYTGSDHNLTPGWDDAVKNALNFYKKYLK